MLTNSILSMNPRILPEAQDVTQASVTNSLRKIVIKGASTAAVKPESSNVELTQGIGKK